MTNTASTHTPACDMAADCAAPVTHLGNKGYVYCAAHAGQRRGVEGTRKLRGWEIHYLRQGRALPSYKPAPEPKEPAAVAEVEPAVVDETDAMDQGEHIAVGDGDDALLIECDCGAMVASATRELTVAAWVRHCEGEPAAVAPIVDEAAAGRVPGENDVPEGDTARGLHRRAVAARDLLTTAAVWGPLDEGEFDEIRRDGALSMWHDERGAWAIAEVRKLVGYWEARAVDTVKVPRRVPGENESACGEVRPGTLGYQLCRLIDEHAGDHRSQDRGAWARA